MRSIVERGPAPRPRPLSRRPALAELDRHASARLPSRTTVIFTLSPGRLAPMSSATSSFVLHALAVDRGDDVAADDDRLAAELARATCRRGGRPCRPGCPARRSARARRTRPARSSASSESSTVRVPDAEVRALDRPPFAQPRDDLLGGVDRDREADADVAAAAAAGRADLGVDADDAAARVEQRAAGVAGVDRGVGLDDVADREALLQRRDLALQRPRRRPSSACGRGRTGCRSRASGRRPATSFDEPSVSACRSRPSGSTSSSARSVDGSVPATFARRDLRVGELHASPSWRRRRRARS